ncbi:MAG: LysM peptidoglycan-binding domain-containing protein [Chloroflexi bacterium]|nr:LysM peptidoglycan-binding domain-containing protein [Chloroflexota bacterium]
MLFIGLLISACTKQAYTAPYINFSDVGIDQGVTSTTDPYIPPTRMPDQPLNTPTSSAPKPLPTMRTEDIYYTVQWGDTVKSIAYQYNLLPQIIIEVNMITDPSMIYTGQQLLLPAPVIRDTGPGYKIIPDSELVRGPYTLRFQTGAFINNQSGYLKNYHEEVDGEPQTGSEIVDRISQDYSVNPRLLLAVIEYQTRWLTSNENKDNPYPLNYREAGYEGLYHQLAWAADEINRGYYLWKVRGIGAWACTDGINVPINPTINAGSAGVQQLFARLLPYEKWVGAVSEGGFVDTYTSLFGYPFDYNFTPLVPGDLTQPPLQLPFEDGVTWLFTGGPHGGWDNGSAWAALDFAPAEKDIGCSFSDDWVVAVADGIIVRSDHGAVVQSIDGDPYDQTGWSILYRHIETRGRVEIGTRLTAGDRIGHPSCEGGISSGSHVHIARRYNGEWIPADQNLPFVMDGWVSQGQGYAYQGLMVKGNQTIQAEDSLTDINQIQR